MNPALARLIAAQICLHAAMAGARMAAPLWALGQGHSPAAVGALLALFALTQVFLALPAGRYADRHGLRRPLGLAVLASALGASLPAALPGFATLCACALLTGGATGVASIALQRHVGRAAEGPTQLRRVFSWLAIGPAVSNFIGPFAAGLLIDHAGRAPADGAGFRWAFGLMAVLALACWGFAQGVRELRPDPAPVQRAGAPRLRAWDLLRDAHFRRLLLVNWFLSAAWDVHTFVVPVLGHERGIGASVIGAILGAFAIAAALVRLALPLLAHRLAEWAVIAGAMAATALLFGVYPLLGSAAAMGAASILLGVALGAVQPMVMSLLHQGTPPARHGEALGLRLMAINASSVAMPLAFGVFGAVLGVAPLFWCVGLVMLAGLRPAVRLRVGMR